MAKAGPVAVDVVLDEGGRHTRLRLLEGGGPARDAEARGGLVGEREGETQQGRQRQGTPEEDGDAEQRRGRRRADREPPRHAADEIGRHRHDGAAREDDGHGGEERADDGHRPQQEGGRRGG